MCIHNDDEVLYKKALQIKTSRLNNSLKDEFGIEVFAYDIVKYRFFIKIVKRTRYNIELPVVHNSPFSYIEDLSMVNKKNKLYKILEERCEADHLNKVNNEMYPSEYNSVKNEILDVSDIMHAHDVTLENCLIISNRHFNINLLLGIGIKDCYCLYTTDRSKLLYYFDKIF